VSNRFVILHHLAPTGEHWDLMLEREDCLWTWQMSAEPFGPEACPIDCVRIADHRKTYLDYEGPISGGRGVVSRVDSGDYALVPVDDAMWVLHLRGRRLAGEFHFVRTDPNSQSRWRFVAS
jgi:DNA polymerase Ligase (LigD)